MLKNFFLLCMLNVIRDRQRILSIFLDRHVLGIYCSLFFLSKKRTLLRIRFAFCARIQVGRYSVTYLTQTVKDIRRPDRFYNRFPVCRPRFSPVRQPDRRHTAFSSMTLLVRNLRVGRRTFRRSNTFPAHGRGQAPPITSAFL